MSLYESVIIDKNTKKVKSDIGESFLVIESGKDLSEVDIKEYNAIVEQDELVNFIKAKNYIKKTGYLYSIGSTVVKVGAFIGLL